jgi:hypothetical protein
MPFDFTNGQADQLLKTDRSRIDPLQRLGIIPIPIADVTTHKQDYERRWRQHYPSRTMTWMVVSFESWKRVHDNRTPHTLEEFLQNPTGHAYSSDKTPAPAELRTLAGQVQDEIPEATFAVEYFDVDPICWVEYDHNGKHQRAALGIWDGSKMVVRAGKTAPVTVAPPKSRWRRMFGL